MFRRGFLMSVTGLMAWGASAASAAPPAHEQTRIERLIQFVETRKGMKFIRNGTEYECAEAGKFLRGKPYEVKFADGKTMLASQFLSDELKRLEGQPT